MRPSLPEQKAKQMLRFKFVERPIRYQVYGPLHFSADNLQESDFDNPPPLIEKMWVTGGDNVCDFCSDLDSIAVPIEDDFDTVEGAVAGPPLHPNCNCDLETLMDGESVDTGIQYDGPALNEQRSDAFTQRDYLREEMPELIDEIPMPIIAELPGTLLAVTSMDSSQIVLSKNMMELTNEEMFALFQDNKKWLVEPTVEGTLTHEVGHAFRNQLHNNLEAEAVQRVNDEINKELFQAMRDGRAKDLSGYAGTSDEEAFAEAFAFIYTAGDPATNAAKYSFTQSIYSSIKDRVK